MKVRKLTIIFVVTMLILFVGCSKESGNKHDFNIVSSNVATWEDTSGETYIILAVEVSNLSDKSVYFKKSDFDIADESGKIIDTMKSVNAYPPVVDPNETSVYYETQTFNEINNNSIRLEVIPHIEWKRYHKKQDELTILGLSSGGSNNAIATVINRSSSIEYSKAHVAVIARNREDKIVCVMTGMLDLIKPHEKIDVNVEDSLQQRDLDPKYVSKFQPFVYLDP